MSQFLTSDQRRTLKRQHSFEHERRYADRIKSLLLWDEGWSLEDIAKVLLLNEKTIRRYRKIFESEGLERLLDDDWKGSQRRLSRKQERELIKHLSETLYTSTASVASYIKSHYRVEYSTRGMHHVLLRLGFVYKKTKPVPGKADPEAQEDYVAMYEELMEEKQEEDPVYFIDGVHAQHNAHPACGWILRGKEKQIPTNTGRERVNINGALNAETLEVFVWEDETINAQSTIALFALLEQNHQDAKNIYIVLDNAGYYRNKLVQYYVSNSKIRLLFLPPYSPNLNLIERLWKFFKKKVANNRYYEKFRDFKKEVLAFFGRIQDYQSELDTLLVDNFQIITPTFAT